MRKSLLSLLVLFVYSLVAFAQQGTEITWTGSSDWSGVAEKAQQISLARGDWSIQASREGGATNPTVNADSKDLRAYAKNLVMVGNDAENIGKLVFHISAQGKKRWADITISEGTITHDTDNGVIIWEAGDADVQYVMLTVGDKATYGTEGATKAGQFDFTSVTAYTKAELTVTEPEPDPVPVLLTSVTPAMTEELTALPEEVVFTFEKDVQEVTSVRLRHNGWGGMRGTELVGEEGLVVTDGATVTVNVPAILVQGVNQMSLTLMGTAVDGGALTDGENGEQVVVQYQYTPNPARFLFVEANPADSSIVEKLDSIIVTFEHPAGGLTGGFAKDVVLEVLDAESNVVTTAKIGQDMATNDGYNNNALITLAAPVTANGTYTITVPEATVFDDQYNDMFEDYGVADWGAIYNPAFTLTYTVEAPEEYPINFPREQVRTRTDRSLSSVSLTAEGQAEQTLTVDYMHPYNDLTKDEGSRLTVPAGATLTTTFGYNGSWMHGYVYIDLDNDKQFSFNEGSTTQTGTDLLTFSFYSGSFTNDAAGYNSLGAYITGDARSVLNPPTFQAPSTSGEYRIRLKVDWNSVDAGGQKAADGTCTGHNGILSNGGYIVDAILVVNGDPTGINAATLDENAKVYTLDGRRVIVNGKLNRGFYIINGQKTFVK